MRTLPILLSMILIVGMIPAFADYGYVKSTGTVQYGGGWGTPGPSSQVQAQVCVYTPLDYFMDNQLTNIVLDQVRTHNVTAVTVSVFQQKMNNELVCTHIINIDRAINQNDMYTDKTTKYLVSNNTATIFTYKTAAPELAQGVPSTLMVNLNCMLEAHQNKYFDNYQISNQGYYSTLHPICNPYMISSPEKVGELPESVIQTSVNQVMKQWGFK